MKQINFEYGRRCWAVTADCERCPKHIDIKELELRESSYFGTGLCAYDPKTNKLVMIATVNDVFDTREEAEDHLRELIERAKQYLRVTYK